MWCLQASPIKLVFLVTGRLAAVALASNTGVGGGSSALDEPCAQCGAASARATVHPCGCRVCGEHALSKDYKCIVCGRKVKSITIHDTMAAHPTVAGRLNGGSTVVEMSRVTPSGL